MKYRFNSLRVIIVSLFVAALTPGCRENTVIHSKVAPSNNSDSVYSYTMPVIITHTFNSDSTITSTNIGGVPVFEGVGAITDPFFGTMTGSTYFQVIPTDFQNVFDTTVYGQTTIDSVILLLPYNGLLSGGLTYGDTTNTSLTQSYQVFYMTDSIGFNNAYYSYSSKSLDVGNPLSDPTPVNLYNIRDTLSINGVYYYNGIRIKLKWQALQKYLIPALSVLATSTSPTTDFINIFKGICVRPTNTNVFTNAFPYIELDGADQYSEANFTVYYHHPNIVPVDTVAEVYYFNTGICAHFNNITRSYSHSPVNALYHSAAANDSIIALANQPGASLDVIIPGIMKSIPPGIVINKVELQLTLLPKYNADSLFAPEQLSPLGVGGTNYPIGVGAGLEYEIADRYPLTSLTPLTIMDGYLHINYNGTTYNRFTIDFPREVMSSITAKNDTLHLHVYGTQDFYGAFHMVAGGGSYADTNYRAKVIVVYSKLKK